jgi:hypothetical protein
MNPIKVAIQAVRLAQLCSSGNNVGSVKEDFEEAGKEALRKPRKTVKM